MTGRLRIFIPHCSELLTDYRPHGDGLVAQGFIRHLAERGHTLHVLTEAVDLEKPMPPNVHITVVGGEDRFGVRYRLRYMRRVRRMFQELRRNGGIDIVHQLNPVYTGLTLAVADARVPLVLGPFVPSWPRDPTGAASRAGVFRGAVRGARTLLARIQQQRAAALLLTTPAAEERLPTAASLRERIYLLPHGLNTSCFVPGGVEEKPEILFLSNLVERKGILDLIEAFALVAPEFPAWRLVIAGDGPERDRSTRRAEQLQLNDRVAFLGRQNREESLGLLQRCGVFCQPSHAEPYGMSAAEAMSCGKPLVVTNAGGLGYLVDDHGGIRVPVRSPEQLAAALRELLADEPRRRRMGLYNRQRALSSMSWEMVVERLEKIYRAAMESSRPGEPAGGSWRWPTEKPTNPA